MKICFSLALLYLLFPTFLSAQGTCDCQERLGHLAWYYYQTENYAQSLAAIQHSIQLDSTTSDQSDYVMLYMAAAKQNGLDLVEKGLLHAFALGYSKSKLDDERLAPIREQLGEKRWANLLEKYEQQHHQYKLHLNLDYYIAIQQLLGSDQRIRSREYSFDTDDFHYVDSINFVQLKRLFDQYGYPTLAKDGFNWESVDVFMLHYSVESPEKYAEVIALLKDATVKGVADKGDLLLIEDRYRVWMEQKTQRWAMWNSWRDKGKFSPIEKISIVDKVRLEHNLLRLKEVAKQEKRALPEGYEVAAYPKGYFCGFEAEF